MLDGIRILDLADENGSFCSRLLADLGASVIKVEKPGGDPSRKKSPFCSGMPDNENSLFFAYHNSNKLSVTLDIEQGSDRIKFFELLKNTDVLIETFNPGYSETSGLSLEKLTEINPALIHSSITGFGRYGPKKNYQPSSIVSAAFGGQMYVCGFPEQNPLAYFGEQSHYISSLFGAVSILLSIRQRALTGKGQFIDISAQEAVASTLDHVMVSYFYNNTVSTRQGNLYGNSFFCILPCKDGYIQISLLQQWDTFVELLASEDMANNLTDKKWSSEDYRIENIDHIIDVVKEWTLKHSVKELFQTGQSMRFPWSPVFSPEEVMQSPQLKKRQFFRRTGYPGNVTIISPGLPYRFSSFPLLPNRRAPLSGEHNSELFADKKRPVINKTQNIFASKDQLKSCENYKHSLKGIRILDFTWMLSGPYATRILADHGAEVIKIQSHKTANGAEANLTGYFNTWNRNKLGITLDISRPEAKDIILKLASVSDVVVENFSPRVMRNWGLDYEQLKQANPDIIMAGISAMGQTGPWKDFVGYGPTFHALSGLTHMTSIGQEHPAGLGHAYADTVIGLYSALAILAALDYRDKTGLGQYIDISGYEAVCTLLGYALTRTEIKQTGNVESYYTNYLQNIQSAPHGCYKCLGKDRWCVIAVFSEEQWSAFCHATGNQTWIKDERFSNIDKRKANSAELDRLIKQWTINLTAETAIEILQSAGIPAGIVQTAEDLAKDSHLKARDFYVEVDHPVLGKTYTDSAPAKFYGNTIKTWKPAPLLGEHNHYVLTDLLGFTEKEITEFTDKGVFY
ncbi:MAG: CoA transferase [Spirochaetes bacterium]|nr:CoA transferase [Spirochaetota bacterium]